jgi:hypothetical protein
MGDVFVAASADVSAVFTNPATLSTLDSSELSATFFKHVLDINGGTVAYANQLSEFGVRDNGTVALTANYINYGRIDRTDRNGRVVGSVASFDIALSAAYSNALDTNWYYGVAFKYITSRIDNVGTAAVATDVGMVYVIPKARVILGVSVLNAGVQVASIGAQPESVPMDVRLGISHQLRGLPLLVSASLNHLADPAAAVWDRFLNFSLGGELSIAKVVLLRVGYENQRRRELAPDVQPRLSGLSGGVGIVLNELRVDYALSSYGTIGALHRFAFSLRL